MPLLHVSLHFPKSEVSEKDGAILGTFIWHANARWNECRYFSDFKSIQKKVDANARNFKRRLISIRGFIRCLVI